MRLAVALLAFAVSLQAQSTLLAPTGTLRASFIATNPVQGRVDAKTGVTTGPATDLIRELARRLAVPFAVTPLPDAGAVLESVKSGKVDVGFLAVEAERATQVDFSDAYASSGAAYAVRADSTFQKSNDVDRPGVTIAAVTGQAPEVYVREHVKNARVQSLSAVPLNVEMGKMLLEGKVDAFAANRTRMEEACPRRRRPSSAPGRLHGHAAGDRRSEGKRRAARRNQSFPGGRPQVGFPAGVARTGERRRCQSGPRAAAIAVTLLHTPVSPRLCRHAR